MDDKREMLRVALEALWALEGRPERGEGDDVLGVLVRMMLAQATSKANAVQAFGDLLDRFQGDWDRVRRAPAETVAAAIAVGGLSQQKAPRIQAMLARTQADFGEYTLEPLSEWAVNDALAYMLAFEGVGPTTARFTLMAAAGMDVFPINGGIRRVLQRFGVLEGTETDKRAHDLVAQLLPAKWVYAAHMTLVEHARAKCQKSPRCEECPVRGCPAREAG